jgi:predicted nucleic acid-binding protein
MIGPVFVDTNILVYARDAGESSKQPLAADVLRLLWETRRGRISPQVLQEYYVTVTRKLRPGLTKEAARDDIRALHAWQPVAPSAATFAKAWEIEDRAGFSWWDSLIVASALESRCTILLSEDLQDGQEIDSLQIRNPFATGFDCSLK